MHDEAYPETLNVPLWMLLSSNLSNCRHLAALMLRSIQTGTIKTIINSSSAFRRCFLELSAANLELMDIWLLFLGLNIKANNTTVMADGSMAYEQAYFTNRKYTEKQQLVERHVLEVLKWATKRLNTDLLNGRDKRALDVGCAYGYTSLVLESLGYETCGVDISSWGIKQAKRQRSGFLVCDAQTALPFRADTFDLVTCFDVLEHLSHPEKALLDMFDACRGVLVCTTPNKKVEKPIRRLIRDYDETHISVKPPSDWKECITGSLSPKNLHVEAFYDLAVRLGGKLFFKSFNIPAYGLTVRVAIRK